MNCKTCVSYPDDPKAIFCNLGVNLHRPALEACGGHLHPDDVPTRLGMSKVGGEKFVTLAVGGRAWRVLRNGMQYLYNIGYFTSPTVNHLLGVLDPDAKDQLSTLKEWDRQRCLFDKVGLVASGFLSLHLHWRVILDTLRQLYLDGKIDMDVVLVALDPEYTGSCSVADLVGAWEQIRRHREDLKDEFDHPMYDMIRAMPSDRIDE